MTGTSVISWTIATKAFCCLLYKHVYLVYIECTFKYVYLIIQIYSYIPKQSLQSFSRQVASIVGRAELLSALFYLSALLASDVSSPAASSSLSRRRLCLAVLFAWLGFLCKEQSLTSLIVISIDVFIKQCVRNRTRKQRLPRPKRDVNCNHFGSISACTRSENNSNSACNTKSAKNPSNCISACNTNCNSKNGKSEKSANSTSACTCASKADFAKKLRHLTSKHPSASSSWRLSSSSRKNISLLLFAFLAATLVRLHLIDYKLASFNKWDNPAAVAPASVRHLTWLFLDAYNFGLLLFPADLSCDWGHNSIPLVSFFADAGHVNHVTRDHVTAAGHVTPSTGHVNLGTDHVTPGNSHMTPGADHVAFGAGHVNQVTSYVKSFLVTFDYRILAIVVFFGVLGWAVWRAVKDPVGSQKSLLVSRNELFTRQLTPICIGSCLFTSAVLTRLVCCNLHSPAALMSHPLFAFRLKTGKSSEIGSNKKHF